MGFCSGTDIFDPVAKVILYQADLGQHQQKILLKALINALYDADWDCESDSIYYNHPLVSNILQGLE